VICTLNLLQTLSYNETPAKHMAQHRQKAFSIVLFCLILLTSFLRNSALEADWWIRSDTLERSTAVFCDASTCRGPVMALFNNTVCDDEPSLYKEILPDIDNVMTGIELKPEECINTTTESLEYTCGEMGISIRQYFTANCTGEHRDILSPSHKCFSFPSLNNISSIFLCNITETIGLIDPPETIAPPIFFQPLEDSDPICPAVDQCTPGVAFYTLFQGLECDNDTAISSIEFERGALLDHCYNNSESGINYEVSCFTGDIVLTRHPSQCNTTAYHTERIPTGICIPLPATNQSISYVCPGDQLQPSQSPDGQSPIGEPFTSDIPVTPTSEAPTGDAAVLDPFSTFLLFGFAFFAIASLP